MKHALIALALIVTPVAMPVVMAQPVLAAPLTGKLGDLSSFATIADDTLTLIEQKDLVAAQKRITDFETAWDAAQPTLYPKDKAAWGVIDDAADAAIKSLRATKPSAKKAKTTVTALLNTLQDPAVK